MFGWKKKDDPKSEEEARRQAERELNETDIGELEKKIAEYEGEKRAAYGDLDRAKERVAKLEKNLLQKKREYDLATGVRKKILASEYKLISDELKRVLGEPTIVERRISHYDSLIAAAREAIALKRGGSVRIDAGQIGDLREEGTRTLKSDADAIAELEESMTGATLDEEFDVEKDFAEFMGETESGSSLSDLERDESPLRDAVGRRRIDPLEE